MATTTLRSAAAAGVLAWCLAHPAAAQDYDSGFIIDNITVTQWTATPFGKKVDDDNPDLYIQFLDAEKKEIGRTNVVAEAQPGRPVNFRGAEMPFRVRSGRTYYLRLRDYDGQKRNRDEVMSNDIPVNFGQLTTAQGARKSSYGVGDTGAGVGMFFGVRYARRTELAGYAAYVPFVKAIDQEIITDMSPDRFEGCGPVAAASVLGWWQTERGYQVMNPADRYDGTRHPTRTIRDFYGSSDTKKSPGTSGGVNMSYTLKMNMLDGLQAFARRANETRGYRPALKADILRRIRTDATKRRAVRRQLLRDNPVIVMFVGQPRGLTGDARWERGRHYVVVVGFNDARREFYILSGWSERDKAQSAGASVHRRGGNPFAAISYDEFDDANTSVFILSD
ncbi:MAG: C39 family peptidase [Pseudomonadota bacterium]